MKQLSRLLLVGLLILGFNSIQAQSEDNPWQIGFGVNAVDFYPVGKVGGFGNEFFNANDHWNILPSISYVGISRHIGDGISIGARGSLNRIRKFGDTRVDDFSYYGIDGTIKYNFIENTTIDPFVEIGGGYTWVADIGAGTLNGGIGANIWFNDNIGLTIQTQYKHSFEDYLTPHFQHMLGLSVRFGGSDTDKDGIYDKDDACPEVPGLEAFNGCPDTDGDGVPDKDDACPTEAGPVELNGCPDRDGDGVADKDDRCPDVAGPVENEGCPWPDADGDGIPDKDDECPNIAGVAENNGCPIVSAEVQKEITDLARAIYFVTGSSKFTDETEIRMEQVSKIVNQYQNLRFDVEGHTDSTGSDAINSKLSQARADAVRAYLIEKGFPADMITAKGFGSSNPIGDNKTRKGRQQNRRVEIFSEYAER